MCQGGKRSEKAAKQLQGKVDLELCIIDGGMNAVLQCNTPLITRARKALSVEQQVRLIAGVLVLNGVALGTWVQPAFYGLSAFVGAGLLLVDVIELFILVRLLVHAPWNK